MENDYWRLVIDPARGDCITSLRQELLLYPHSPIIHCKTTLLDYSETNFLYKVAIPARLAGRVPLFEERFFTMGRDPNPEHLNYSLHASPAEPGREYPTTDFAGIGVPAALTSDGQPLWALATAELIAQDPALLEQCAEPLQRALVSASVSCTPTLEAVGHSDRYYNGRFGLAAGQSALVSSRLEAAGSKAQQYAKFELGTTGVARLVVPDLHKSDALPCGLLLAHDDAGLRKLVDDVTGELAAAHVDVPSQAVFADLGA